MSSIQDRIVKFLDGPFIQNEGIRGNRDRKYATHGSIGGLKGDTRKTRFREPEKKKDKAWWNELEKKLDKVGKEGKRGDYELEYTSKDNLVWAITFRGRNKKVADIENEYFIKGK